MAMPKDLGKTSETPEHLIRITTTKLSEHMGAQAAEIFDWVQDNHPASYDYLVVDNPVDREWAAKSDAEQIKKTLREWYRCWMKMIREYHAHR